MEILWLLIVGLIAGLLARAIMPGDDSMGILLTIVLGIVGAFIAGFLGRALGIYESTSEGGHIIAATIGAIILLAVARLVKGRGRHRPHHA